MDKNNIENLLKLAYQKFKEGPVYKSIGKCVTDEDTACFLEGKLSIEGLDSFNSHILSCRKCADSLRDIVVVSRAMKKEELSVPMYLEDLAKSLVSEEVRKSVLDIALKFKEKAIEVIRTTGEIIIGSDIVPLPVLRSSGNTDNLVNEVTITKALDYVIAEILVEKQKPELANIVVRLTEKETNKKAKEIRVSLMKGDRELQSSLLEDGKVKFEEIKANNYKIYLTKDEEKIGLINISISTK